MTTKQSLRISVLLFLLVLAPGYLSHRGSAQSDITLTVSTTSRQAVVSYTAPSTSPCLIEVSESNTYSPLVNDVDSTLFSGANSDDRSGSLGAGTISRVMLIGTIQNPSGTVAVVAQTGKQYSRALHVDTTHYFRVTCGSHTGTASASTRNIPLGKTYGEPPPISAAGVYGFPTVNWNDRSETFIDPVFGTRVRKVSKPGDEEDPDQVMGTSFGLTGACTGWTNAGNIIADDGRSATYTGTTNQKCLIKTGSFSFSDAYAPDSFRLYIKGHSDVSTGNNNVLSACVTIDGANCALGAQTRDYTLPLARDDMRCQPNGGSETSCASPAVPIDTWTTPAIIRDDVVGNANFGWLIWKKGRGTGTISVQFAKYDLRRSLTAIFTQTGSQWMAAQQTTNDSHGTPGYLHQIMMQNGPTHLVWIDTATGTVRWLGQIRFSLAGFPNQSVGVTSATFDYLDPSRMYFLAEDARSDVHAVKCQLPRSGNRFYDTDVAQSGSANCSWTDLGNLPTLVHNFDASYDQIKFRGFNLDSVQQQYMLIVIRRSSQDSIAWLTAFDTSNHTIKGAMPMWKRALHHWCGFHTGHQALGTPKYSYTAKELQQGGTGMGPYQTKITANIDGTTNPVTISVAGEPRSAFADATLDNVAAGDEFAIGSEWFGITSRNGSTSWTVSRAVGATHLASHPSGATLTMECACHQSKDQSVNAISWWDFEADPTGSDTTGTNLKVLTTDLVNGHEGWANGYKIGEGGWYAAIVPAATASRPALFINNSPTFAGAAKTALGNTWQQHPAPPQQTNAITSEKFWAVDTPILDADPETSPTSLTNVTGSLWKYANRNYTMDRKRLPMLATAGVKILLDISSPATGNVIGGSASDNYKYCVANAVNECRTGSSVGDIYINAPALKGSSGCPNGFLARPDKEDVVCLGHFPANGQTVVQIGIVEANATGKWQRSLTQMFTPMKRNDVLSNAHMTPDAKWILFPVTGDNRFDAWMVEAPPYPGYDSIDRNTFIQTAITVSAVRGADNAVIEFGYDPNFYPTSRAEVGVSAARNDPFFFASEAFSGIVCSSGCTVNIPMIPDRVAYYRIKWRNGSRVVHTSATLMAAEGSAPGDGGATRQRRHRL